MHPTDGEKGSYIYLMCDDLQSTLDELASRNVTVTQPITEQRWGKVTAIRILGDVELGLYQPYYTTALTIAAEQSTRYVRGAP